MHALTVQGTGPDVGNWLLAATSGGGPVPAVARRRRRLHLFDCHLFDCRGPGRLVNFGGVGTDGISRTPKSEMNAVAIMPQLMTTRLRGSAQAASGTDKKPMHTTSAMLESISFMGRPLRAPAAAKRVARDG
jgi:hypothetical protein